MIEFTVKFWKDKHGLNITPKTAGNCITEKLLRQHSSLKNQKKKLSDKALSKAASTTTNVQTEQ